MKIGIYDPYLDTLAGGERYMLTIAECLSSGHEVSVFWDDKSIIRSAYLKLGINLERVKFTRNIFSNKILFLDKLKESKNYDLIFFLTDGSIPFTFSKKLILHFQHPVEWVKTDSFFFKLKMARINNIICNSYFTKNYIDRKFGKESIILYPPFDRKNFMKDSTEKENSILTVGRYSRMPNGKDFKKHTVLINVFKEMVDKGLKDWQFDIVTNSLADDKKFVNEIEKMAADYPIKLHCGIDNPELVMLYKKAKIYWHAAGFGEDLRKNPERAEHFGISTVESMSAGCVPVVIDAGGQKEIVRDGDNGFLWTRTSDLMEKTLALIKNEKIWENISLTAKQDARYYDKERFCREIKEIIRDL